MAWKKLMGVRKPAPELDPLGELARLRRRSAAKKPIDRDLALSIAGGAVAAVLGVSMMVVGASASASAQDETAQLVQASQEARTQAATAESLRQALPTGREGARLLERAGQAASESAEAQNGLLEEAGPLSMEGVPTHEEPQGAQRRGEELSPEQRRAIAEDNRNARISEYEAVMRTSFLETGDDFDVLAPWHEQVSMTEDHSPDRLQWSASQPASFDSSGKAEVVWVLESEDEDAPLGWVSAVYDPVTASFTGVSIGSGDGGRS